MSTKMSVAEREAMQAELAELWESETTDRMEWFRLLGSWSDDDLARDYRVAKGETPPVTDREAVACPLVIANSRAEWTERIVEHIRQKTGKPLDKNHESIIRRTCSGMRWQKLAPYIHKYLYADNPVVRIMISGEMKYWDAVNIYDDEDKEKPVPKNGAVCPIARPEED